MIDPLAPFNGTIINSTTFSPLNSDRTVITTDYLLKLCGMMDVQAYYAAYVGFVLAVIAILWFGRLRKWVETKEKYAWFIPLFDKLVLTLIGICFAFMIARLGRGD